VPAEVAHRLAGAVRGGDELARWGGDEFVAILPGTDRAGALRAAERLRGAVAAAAIEAAGTTLDVTVSVGWAHWAGDTPDDLPARADGALYQAKDAGRNQVFPPG
jgi:diguanylate cyclase (GGDEF)-like protein